MNMKKMILAVGSILFIGVPARADYGADPPATFGVDIKEEFPSDAFSVLPASVLGSGTYLIANHDFDQVLEFNLSGTITGLTLGGEVTGLRHLSTGGDDRWPTYASMGMPASFFVGVAVIPPPPSFDATSLGTTIVGSSDSVGYGSVDDGISMGGVPVGPAFSITLSAAAVAAANQAIAAGDPFYLVLSGRGHAGLDSSLEGDLSSVTLGVQTASQPSFSPTPVPEPSTFALLTGGLSGVGICRRFTARARRGRRGGRRGRPPCHPGS